MAALETVLVRGIQDGAAMGREGGAPDVEGARSEQTRDAAGNGDGVEVQVTILPGGKSDAVAGGKRETLGFCLPGQRILRARAAAPDRVGAASTRIGDPDGEGTRMDGNDGVRETRTGGAQEGQTAAAGRPAGHVIAIYAGRDIAQAMASKVVNGDKAMIAAQANEGDAVSAGRPVRADIVA